MIVFNKFQINNKILYDIQIPNYFSNNIILKHFLVYYLSITTNIFLILSLIYKVFLESLLYLKKYSCYKNKKDDFFYDTC